MKFVNLSRVDNFLGEGGFITSRRIGKEKIKREDSVWSNKNSICLSFVSKCCERRNVNDTFHDTFSHP